MLLEDERQPAVVVATLGALPAAEGERRALLAAAAGHAEVLELRADLVGEAEPALLRRDFPGRLLYTLRSRAEGGAFDGGDERRHERLLAAAAADWDVLDLEADRDLVPAVLAAVEPERRLVSWHGPPADPVEIEARLAALFAVPARLYKLVVFAQQPGDELPPLLAAADHGRDDLLAFAAGTGAAWTRFVAPRIGARVVFAAAAAGAAGAPGQLTVEELARDYGLPDLPPATRAFGIVGQGVLSRSLSPRLHNAALRALGIPAVYLPFETASFGDFWLEVVESGAFERCGLELAGLSVTAPYKRAALAVAGAVSPLAESIGAANTLVRREGVWEAESTDPDGVVGPLVERGVAISGREAVVIGAGGAGRSAAVGLARAGARVTLVNRDGGRGREAADALEVPFLPLAELDPEGFDLVVHATSLGRSAEDRPPLDAERLAPGAALVDLVYDEGPTRLVAAARARGLVAVDGREVLLHQAIAQFRLMTGHELPLDLGRRVLGLPAVVAEPTAADAAEEAG
ncbi:MAG TPA: type I 3-dehydroquinate dehydratase [Thermoanaerobaculia bacterium]|nr:type I 3-dehydroquinate dehydratase [Thermoanaerobaculia bacterium]